jgi:hypothetical protein
MRDKSEENVCVHGSMRAQEKNEKEGEDLPRTQYSIALQ